MVKREEMQPLLDSFRGHGIRGREVIICNDENTRKRKERQKNAKNESHAGLRCQGEVSIQFNFEQTILKS